MCLASAHVDPGRRAPETQTVSCRIWVLTSICPFAPWKKNAETSPVKSSPFKTKDKYTQISSKWNLKVSGQKNVRSEESKT